VVGVGCSRAFASGSDVRTLPAGKRRACRFHRLRWAFRNFGSVKHARLTRRANAKLRRTGIATPRTSLRAKYARRSLVLRSLVFGCCLWLQRRLQRVGEGLRSSMQYWASTVDGALLMHCRQRRIVAIAAQITRNLRTCHSQSATLSLTRESTRAMRERSRCAWPSSSAASACCRTWSGGAERDEESRRTSSLIRAQYQIRSCGLRRSRKRAEASLRSLALELDVSRFLQPLSAVFYESIRSAMQPSAAGSK